MLKLYPMPLEIIEKEGKYEFLYSNVNGIENEIILNTYKEMGISLSADKEANITYTKKGNLDFEEYELIINENGAEIFYTFENGAFYGTQTLCQLINMKKAPFVEIKDKPLLKERTLLFDISRGKVPTMSYFKKIIDILAMARYNTFCLYYDRLIIQFPNFKDFWEDDAITEEELWQIKKWCNEKFIKLTIYVETFGHLENFLKYDRFKYLTNSLDETKPGGDINPYHPDAMKFVEMIIEDVIPFVDTNYLSVGGDEVHSLKTGKTKDVAAQKGIMTVYMEHMSKVCELVYNKYKKIPMVCNDMFMRRTMTEEEMEENLKLFPKNAMIVDWGYESEYEYHRFDRTNTLLKKHGIPFLNLASTGTFVQYVPRTYNQMLNAEVNCRQAYEKGGVGAGTSCFYDGGGSNFFVIDFGGIFTFGSTAWNYKGFQLSYVHNYMDKYLYKAQDCEFAKTVASIGDATWYTKGKCPESNLFATTFKAVPYNSTLFWNGYHAHTGIDQIHINDMVDEYGCKKAMEHVRNSEERLKKCVIKCAEAEEYMKKIMFDLRLFELAIKVSYFKLCILVTKDFEAAKEYINDIKAAFNELIEAFPKLWVTESRPARVEIFMTSLEKYRSDFINYLEKTPELN